MLAVLVWGCSRGADDDGDSFLSDGRTLASDADADTYTGPSPLTVHFTAKTINAFGTVSYHWSFDDRSPPSTEQNPSWVRMQRGRDMRIVLRSLREVKRKNQEPALPAPD